MAINLQKINIKFYLAENAVPSPEEAFRIFSQWIPLTTDEILIDVADYRHVARGPKTVLVGHGANYTFDNSDGRYGLLYGCKIGTQGSNAARLRAAFAASLKACVRLEQAENTVSKPRFVGAEAVITINDRLHAANSEATLEQIRADLESVLDDLYAGAPTQIEREGDARQRFTVRVRVEGDFETADLLANLAASGAGAGA
ncbi:MAG: hypothetical protein O2782_07345 [bacterium]|nr:hypothetical protein [bacterium]